MKIQSSLVAMRSQHQRMELTQEQHSLRRRGPPAVPPSLPAAQRTDTRTSQSELLQEAEALGQETEELGSLDELKLHIIKLLLERFTGMKIKLFSRRELQDKMEELQARSGEPTAQASRVGSFPAPYRGGDFALAYDYSYTHVEQENTSIDLRAKVQTTDGKTLEVELQLNLSRQLFQHTETRLLIGEQKKLDPLVINFQGSSAELTQQRFQFDLNADGFSERIAMLKSGSAFLALDKNGDGVVNDGRELFGAIGGDGFEELASYDSDGNHFIDEADAIFRHLKLWTRDAEGRDQLLAIGQMGIGAIYLGHVGSEFSLMAGEQQAGQLRQTGFFLREDGSAGTVQQIDLMV